MIISRTPYRLSFFGGGTDYPEWYRKNGGAVLSTTIDKYCYLSCRYYPPFFHDVKHRIVWSHIETVSTISEILHPAVRQGLHFLGFDDSVGLEIHHQGDLPSRAGIGSSSSFVVGLINALVALRGMSIGKHELALKAIELEQNVMKESVGSQDQVAAAYGGLNAIYFMPNGDIEVNPVDILPSRLLELESHLMLFYTGTSRLGPEIAKGIIENLGSKQDGLHEMRRMVDCALPILHGNGDLDGFGRLLHRGWLLKRELTPAVSSDKVDNIYRTAMEHGALGGKLLGAGSAGFMVFYVPLEKQKNVADALSGYLQVPFKFEKEGSSLLVNGQAFEGNVGELRTGLPSFGTRNG